MYWKKNSSVCPISAHAPDKTQDSLLNYMSLLLIADAKYLQKRDKELTNCTFKENTGCLITQKPINRGDTYPRVYFSYNKRKFHPNLHAFIFKVTNNIAPHTSFEGQEVSHLCHNKMCINIDHIRLEPKKINLDRMKCNAHKHCFRHDTYEKCMSFYSNSKL